MAAVLTTSLLSGCKGFLEQVDQDKFIPSTADHYASLMLREFDYNYKIMSNVQLMSDEMEDSDDLLYTSGGREQNRASFTWQRDIEMRVDNYARFDLSSTWLFLYRNIAICNYVIELIDDAEGTDAEIASVKGEACFIRAYCYFVLTNLYAEPYRNATQASETLGVPLRTDIGVVATYEKSKLNECYNQIVNDLTEARDLIKSSGTVKSIYHPSVDACNIMLSRVHLFMNDYDAVIADLSDVLADAPLNRFTALGEKESPSATMTENCGEVVYAFGVGTTYSRLGSVRVSDYLLDLFDDNDLRPAYWFIAIRNSQTLITTTSSNKTGTTFTTVGQCMLRLPEAYLNRAEAYARKGQTSQAVADVEKVAVARHRSGSAIAIPSVQTDLVKYIYDERMREFCFEEYYRWFDLRRMPVEERSEIVHNYKVFDGRILKRTEKYILLTDDPNYTLSVPYAEKEKNPFIYDYERYDKIYQ